MNNNICISIVWCWWDLIRQLKALETVTTADAEKMPLLTCIFQWTLDMFFLLSDLAKLANEWNIHFLFISVQPKNLNMENKKPDTS